MRILLLGGTGEARELAHALAGARGLEIVSSLAGRVSDPVRPGGIVRVGGFGGAEGLRNWLTGNAIELIVDATHPFAATMTAHAARASAELGLPMIRLNRPGWTPVPGDHWLRVPDMAAAAPVSAETGDRILLTIGRQGVGAFAGYTRPWYLIRTIDPPDAALPPRHEVLLARGPFTVESESALLAQQRIEVLVTKDSGGAATSAKLAAAREAGIPVVMVDRPPAPPGLVEVTSLGAAREWVIDYAAAHRGRTPERR
ncbi:cobalt-precorrin-6A reductase [Nocardia flavorosea]|uniref:cobalt-precorrin-6A reductase n=1 Tax=Nocardia flavorosea TaxID=53429 RepID=UPI00245401C0|nr:cobalt-precorrin-6A reductase [Nocardia flavorosea]